VKTGKGDRDMELNEVYKCEKCGNIVTLSHVGGGTLECCGQAMVLLEEKTADIKTEKHVPVIEKTDNGYKVTVGSTLHPMEDKHYIEWIEIIADNRIYRQYLKPGDEPIAVFCKNADNITAREYCNVHGLWKGEQ
jgi:superoxide reductase